MSGADGMIAAVALINGGRLATRNVRDFKDTGLTVINPWDM
jgi:predicted nucleic acid-binding protein